MSSSSFLGFWVLVVTTLGLHHQSGSAFVVVHQRSSRRFSHSTRSSKDAYRGCNLRFARSVPEITTLYNHLDDQSVWFHSQHVCSFEQTSAILWRRQDASSSMASDGGNKTDDVDDASTTTKTTATANKSKTKSVQQTWQWCQHFVVPLNLCPWAPASVAAPGAMQFYVVSSKSLPQTSSGFEYYYYNDKHELEPTEEVEEDSSSYLTSIVYSVAERFAGLIREFQQQQQLEKRNRSPAIDLAKVAIAFVILENEPQETSSFEAFYNWFIRLEDYWIDQGDRTDPDSVYNSVTLAAFHPQWEFGGNDYEDDDDKSGLDYEKRSPHPTISLVWTDTIHAAGQEATERIAAHNEHLLQNEISFQQIKRLYDEAIQ